MRILHIMNYYQENMGYQENWLPYYQKKHGHEVEVLTSDRYFPFPNYEVSMQHILGDRVLKEGIYEDKGVKIIRKKAFFEYKAKALVSFSVDYIKIFKPTVIHLHGNTNINLFQVLRYVKAQKIKLFIDSHADYQVANYRSVFNKVYYFCWKQAYRLNDVYIQKFLPITQEALEFLQKEFDIKQKRMVINYLGVNVERFYFDEKSNKEIRNQYNLEEKIVLINAGKQYEGKKIDFIINLLKILIHDFKMTNLALILIGNADEDYKQKIELAAKGLEDYIIRLPFVKNELLKAYYSSADIGVWPGVPSNTIQEAMACETALLLPKNGTINHLIKQNGFFLESENLYESAHKLYKMIISKEYKNCKKNSRKIACQYSWENIARESIEIYEQ